MASYMKTSRILLIALFFWLCGAAFIFITQTPTLHCPAAIAIRKSSETCCQDYIDYSVSSQVLSKHLVVRRVFFDPRGRDGYCNATVFLLEAKGLTLTSKHFSGCRVGPYFSDKFRFRPPQNYRWVQIHKHTSSSLGIIDCYNVPEVGSGDSASLYYTSYTGQVVEVNSLRPLFIPNLQPVPNQPSVTAVVCAGMIRTGEHSPSEHGMLYHWLRYQKTIGVDHVHLAVEDSFVKAGGLRYEAIQQAVIEGFLSIDFWPNWLNFTEIYNSQKLAYQDCLYRFQGAYDYIIYADSDDFFVPLRKSKSIKDYLLKWCSGSAGTCRFTWRQFFPDCGWDPSSIGADGNLTAAITYQQTMDRTQTKSAHQLTAVLDAGTHSAQVLFQGYSQVKVPVATAYMAHLRFGWMPDGGC